MALSDRIDALATRVGAELKGKAKKKPGLLDAVVWGEAGRGTIAHRNGMGVWPEASMEGMEACATSGFHLEVDVRALSDGTLVCVHDSTVDRTMINISTGNVSAKTVKQWRQARIVPALPGWPTGTPMFFTDVLDRFGGRHLIVPELQDTGALTAFIAAIKDRGLEGDVLTQSSDWTTAQALATAGLEVMYLKIEKPTESWSTIKAAGVNYVGGGHNIASWSSTEIGNAKTAGLTPIAFTPTTPTEAAAAWTRGWMGMFTDDPWWLSGEMPLSNNLSSFTQAPPPGTRFVNSNGTGGLLSDIPKLVGGGIGLARDSAAAIGAAMNCYWVPKFSLPVQIDMDIDFDMPSNASTSNIGITAWKNTSTPDADWGDAAITGQSGFTVILRRNGEIGAWTYTNGAAASSMGTPAQLQWYGSGASLVSKAAAEQNSIGTAHLQVRITSTSLWVHVTSSNTDVTKSASWSHSLNLTDLRLAARWGSTEGRIRNLSVTPF